MSVTVSRRVRAVAAIWGLLFAANALLAPALCQQFRQDPARTAQGHHADSSSAAATHAGHHLPAAHRQHAHHGPAAEPAHSAAPEHGAPSDHLSDATCDFCVLTTVADTSAPARLAAPEPEFVPYHAVPAHPVYLAAAPLPLIRAPPSFS